MLIQKTRAVLALAALAAATEMGWSLQHFQAFDPSDDFSYTLRAGSDLSTYRLMSVEQIAQVFARSLPARYAHRSQDLAIHLNRLCRIYHYDPALILSLIHVESSFRPNAVSPVGAIGLMQVMPSTAAIVAQKLKLTPLGYQNLHDPFFNLSVGIAYLSDLRSRYRGESPFLQFVAYNYGPSKVRDLQARVVKTVTSRKYTQDLRNHWSGLRFKNPI